VADLLILLALCARTDGCTVREPIRTDGTVLHCSKELSGLLTLLALDTR